MADWPEAELVKACEFNARWYRLPDTPIHIYTDDGIMGHNATDVGMALAKEIVQSVPPEEPFFFLVDFSAPNQGFTVYEGQQSHKFSRFLKNYRNAPTYIALVTSNPILSQAMDIFIRALLNRENFIYRTFAKKEDSILWLKRMVEKVKQEDID